MPSAIQQRNIPEVIRSLSGMDSPDYIDLFTVTTNGAAAASAEEWATAIEDVAGLGGQFIWRGVLGLRLTSRPSTERVGGALASLLGGLIVALGAAAAVFLTLNRQPKDERGRIYSALRTEVMECRGAS